MSFKDRIIPNKHFLYLLSKSKPIYRKKLLEIATKEELKAIIDILFNISRGSVKIPPSSISRGRKYRQVIKKLISKRGSLGEKRKLLIQRGGAIFPLLMIPALIKSVVDIIKGQ